MNKIDSVLFMVNPKAGRQDGKWVSQLISESTFSQWAIPGINFRVGIINTEPYGKTIEMVRKELLSDHIDLLCVVSGDGGINEVVNGIMKSGLPFEKIPLTAIIPIGIGNDLGVRNLGYSEDPRKATKWIFKAISSADILEYADIVNLDLGEAIFEKDGKTVNRFWISTFSIGVDADVNKCALESKANSRFFRPGKLNYARAALPFLLGLNKVRCLCMKIETDGIAFNAKATLCLIGNLGKYGGIFNPVPENCHEDGKWLGNDGLLHLLLTAPLNKVELIQAILMLRKGTHVFHPKVMATNGILPKATRVKVLCEEEFCCQMDGECIGGLKEVEFTVWPQAIRFLVPKPWRKP